MLSVFKMSSWEPYVGPKDGTGWRSTITGEIRYQEDRPGDEDQAELSNSGNSVSALHVKELSGQSFREDGWVLTSGIFPKEKAESLVERASKANPGRVYGISESKGGWQIWTRNRRSDDESGEVTEEDKPRKGPAVIPFEEIHSDPARFQYKIEGINESGVTDQFDGIDYNPEFAGMLYVWNDPDDGKTYVVNGNHRYQLAKRSGYTGDAAVYFIDRPTAEEARAFGALVNIAEKQGTAMDAANFFRDMGMTGKQGLEFFRKHNISVKNSLARDAVTLANLSDNVFRELRYKRLQMGHALAIGSELKPTGDEEHDISIYDAQNKLLKRIMKSKRKLTNAVVTEMAINYSLSPSVRKESDQGSLFGSSEEEELLVEDRSIIQSFVRGELVKRVSGFGAVSSRSRESLIEESGIGTVSAEKAAEKKHEAIDVLELFASSTRLKGGVSQEVNSILNEAAIAHNKSSNKSERNKIKRSALNRIESLISEFMEVQE